MLESLKYWAASVIFKRFFKDIDLSSTPTSRVKVTLTFEVDSEDNSFDSRGAFSNEYDISSLEGFNNCLDAIKSQYSELYTRILRCRWHRR